MRLFHDRRPRSLLLVLAATTCLWMTPIAHADEDERLARWYERLQKELVELEQRVRTLDGRPASDPAVAKTRKNVAGMLLELTNRMMDLEKRIAALEKGVPTTGAAESGDAGAPEVADASPAAKTGKSGKGAADGGAEAEKLPAFLEDKQLAAKIPEPKEDSAVDIVTTDSGLKKGVVTMPKGRATGPFGRLACTPGAEVFLVQDAPVFGLTLVLVNKVRFRFEHETHVYVIIDGNTTKSAMRWKGTTVEGEKPGELFYVETLHFGLGLGDMLRLIDAGRVRIQVGACEFVLERLCIIALRDLCSCLHPDRVNRLR